jgi:hypothetical protein
VLKIGLSNNVSKFSEALSKFGIKQYYDVR